MVVGLPAVLFLRDSHHQEFLPGTNGGNGILLFREYGILRRQKEKESGIPRNSGRKIRLSRKGRLIRLLQPLYDLESTGFDYEKGFSTLIW